MSRADLSIRNKATAALPQKPGRTAARRRDQKIKANTPKVRRLITARSIAIRSHRAQQAKAARLAAGVAS